MANHVNRIRWLEAQIKGRPSKLPPLLPGEDGRMGHLDRLSRRFAPDDPNLHGTEFHTALAEYSRRRGTPADEWSRRGRIMANMTLVILYAAEPVAAEAADVVRQIVAAGAADELPDELRIGPLLLAFMRAGRLEIIMQHVRRYRYLSWDTAHAD